MEWYGTVWNGTNSLYKIRYGMVRYSSDQIGLDRIGSDRIGSDFALWYGTVWYGMVRYITIHIDLINSLLYLCLLFTYFKQLLFFNRCSSYDKVFYLFLRRLI